MLSAARAEGTNPTAAIPVAAKNARRVVFIGGRPFKRGPTPAVTIAIAIAPQEKSAPVPQGFVRFYRPSRPRSSFASPCSGRTATKRSRTARASAGSCLAYADATKTACAYPAVYSPLNSALAK